MELPVGVYNYRINPESMKNCALKDFFGTPKLNGDPVHFSSFLFLGVDQSMKPSRVPVIMENSAMVNMMT